MHTARPVFISVLFISVLLASSLASARSPEVGDVVFAKWEEVGWYHGKIDGRCDGGFHVLFDDKDKGCIKAADLALDRVPEPEQVRVGVRVLARWDDGRFYPGKVAEIKGRSALIAYDDGDKGEAGIGDLRIIGY